MRAWCSPVGTHAFYLHLHASIHYPGSKILSVFIYAEAASTIKNIYYYFTCAHEAGSHNKTYIIILHVHMKPAGEIEVKFAGPNSFYLLKTGTE